MAPRAKSYVALDAMIERVRKLPKIPAAVCSDVAAMLREETTATIARAQAPSGETWKPTQDGRQALRNAASAIAVGITGSKVALWVTGVEARHNNGWVRSSHGKLARPFIPTRLTPRMIERLREICARHFREAAGGEHA